MPFAMQTDPRSRSGHERLLQSLSKRTPLHAAAAGHRQRDEANHKPWAKARLGEQMMMLKKVTLAAAVAAAVALPLSARAESNVTTGGGSISASARVNFSVVIPRFIFLQVGTGTLLAPNGTIDTISFAPTVAQVGTSAAIAGTGGDLPGGAVTVRIIGNAGSVTLAAVSGAPTLVSGTDTIPWTQISTAITGGATHPTINGASASFAAVSGVVNVNGSWAYSYLNSITPAAGTYTGQVTYTATTP
jgi:hypothetical protein